MRTVGLFLILCFLWILAPAQARAQLAPLVCPSPGMLLTCAQQIDQLAGPNFTILRRILGSNANVTSFNLQIGGCFLFGTVTQRFDLGNGNVGTLLIEGGIKPDGSGVFLIGKNLEEPQVDTCLVDIPHEPCPEFDESGGGIPGRQVCDPILLDFGALGFDLTGARDGVSFDIDADGTPDAVSWTRRGSLDAFLALDRNGNGVVDDGAELFGNVTPLVDGTLAPHGYAGLAELDLPAQGGNGNGYIDRGDHIYPRLLLWTDTNHDGVSDPIELATLGGRGVVAIRIGARRSPAIDEHGNVFSLVSLAYVKTRAGMRTILTSDVSLSTTSQSR